MAMNKYLLSCFFMVISFASYCQFERLVVEKVDSSTYGVTYRVYAELNSSGDQIMVVFGDKNNALRIESTQPFFQSKSGGGLSTQVRKYIQESDTDVRYDSWLTIARENNYENQTKSLGLQLMSFEKEGGSIIVNDGAWYCLPTDKQTICNDSKRILLMQLTTHGRISGTISILGRTAKGENFELRGIGFSSH
jgi:hypothetical protein